jgi:hypothetical protein
MYLRVQKEILELTQGRSEGRLKITLAPGVGDFVRERQDRLEKIIRRSVEVDIDRTLAWEDYRIVLE